MEDIISAITPLNLPAVINALPRELQEQHFAAQMASLGQLLPLLDRKHLNRVRNALNDNGTIRQKSQKPGLIRNVKTKISGVMDNVNEFLFPTDPEVEAFLEGLNAVSQQLDELQQQIEQKQLEKQQKELEPPASSQSKDSISNRQMIMETNMDVVNAKYNRELQLPQTLLLIQKLVDLLGSSEQNVTLQGQILILTDTAAKRLSPEGQKKYIEARSESIHSNVLLPKLVELVNFYGSPEQYANLKARILTLADTTAENSATYIYMLYMTAKRDLIYGMD